MGERHVVFKITVVDVDSGDAVETFYTDTPLLELCDALRESVLVFDTEAELRDNAREDDRG